MEIDITLTTRITVPDGSTVAIAPTGAVMGFTMPCGRLVRPQIVMELEEDDENRDLSYDEEMALGIDTTGADVDRQISEA